MVNYVFETKHDLNLRYIFPKADLQTAVKDHDHLDRPYTEYRVIERNKVSFIYYQVVLYTHRDMK